MKRKYPKVIISEEGEKWLDKGQMWMYRNNAVNIDETIENGALVDIITTTGVTLEQVLFLKIVTLR